VGRNFIGIDQEKEFLELSQKRKMEIEDPYKSNLLLEKTTNLIRKND